MLYYTYKVTFKDLPCYFYYGRHKDNGKEYLGSPTTWAHLWQQFEPEIQILQWYETEEEVRLAEDSILRATWRGKYSLNENVGGHISEEGCKRGGKATGVANGRANLAKIPKEAMAAGGRAAMAKMPKETRVANGRAMNCHENTKKQQSANGRAAASQRWQCLITGFVANSGNLSQYQKAKGIDTTLRIRLQD
jgi:hypothetical protein